MSILNNHTGGEAAHGSRALRCFTEKICFIPRNHLAAHCVLWLHVWWIWGSCWPCSDSTWTQTDDVAMHTKKMIKGILYSAGLTLRERTVWITKNSFLMSGVAHLSKFTLLFHAFLLEKQCFSLKESLTLFLSCNSQDHNTESGGFLAAWSTKWVPGQAGLHRETKNLKKNKKKKIWPYKMSLTPQASRCSHHWSLNFPLLHYPCAQV